MSVAHGAPADDDDIRDLVRTLALTTPDQRMAWLESAFEQALDVALDRLERGLLTIDSEGEIWPDALAVEYLWRIGKVRNVPAIHPAAVRIAAITQGVSAPDRTARCSVQSADASSACTASGSGLRAGARIG